MQRSWHTVKWKALHMEAEYFGIWLQWSLDFFLLFLFLKPASKGMSEKWEGIPFVSLCFGKDEAMWEH